MNNLQFSVSTNEQLLLPLPPYYYFNPFLMQELFVLPYWSGTQALYQHQYPSQYPSRAPSSEPSRYQHGRRFHRTEPRHASDQFIGESSGRIEGDRSTGIRPGQARPGSVPTSTQELARYGEPRQRTHLQLTAT